MKTRTKRIWTYWNGGDVRLELHEGKPVTLAYCKPTDEGHTGERREYTLDSDGQVFMRYYSFGRDCDGGHSEEGSRVWDGRTYFHADGLMFPKFENFEEPSMWDENAEAMGY